MTIIGSAYVEIRALDTNLRRDIDNAMKQVKDVTLNLKADVNLAPVRAKITELRAELRNNPLKFHTEVDETNIVSSLAEAHKLYEDNPLHITAEADTTRLDVELEAARQRFNNIDATINANADTTSAESQLAAVSHRRSVPINANADTGAAEAQLRLLERKRVVPVFAKFELLDAEAKKALSGLYYTMIGAVPAPAIKEAVSHVLANIEQLSIAMAKVSTIAGAAGAGILTFGANIFSVSGDIADAVGLLGVAPAAIFGVVAAVKATTMAWNNFGAAMKQATTPAQIKAQQAALAKLPPEAQKAVKALTAVRGEIEKPVQRAYWEAMGTSLQDMVKAKLPEFKKGMTDVGGAMGRFTATALNAIKGTQSFSDIFGNTSSAIGNLTKALSPAITALQTWISVGSAYLPRFGNWVADLANKFGDWTKKAQETGQMNIWIEQGITTVKELGSVLSSTVGIFRSLTEAARKADAPGLDDLAKGLGKIRDTFAGEPFQTKLVTILDGARKGMEGLSGGLKSISTVAGESSLALGNFFKLGGETGGALLTNISKIFSGTGLGDGFTTFLLSINQAMKDLEPSFHDIGTIMGDFSTIAGTVIRNMVPGFNNLLNTISKVLGNLKDGVVAVIPIFNDFVQNILIVLAPIVIAASDALGKLLEGFAGLPPALQGAIMGLGLFFFALSKIKKLFNETKDGEMTSFQKKVQDIRKGLQDTFGPGSKIGDGISMVGASAGYAKEAVGKAFKGIMDDAKIAGAYVADGFKKSFSQIGDEAKKLGPPLKEFGSMMGAIMKEALLPEEVRNGFKGIGEKFANLGRTIAAPFIAAKDTIAKFAKGVAEMFPASLLGPALKALPGEIGSAMALAGQNIANGVSHMANMLAGPQFRDAMGKLGQFISDHSLYASKRLEDIGNGIKAAATTIASVPATIGSSLGKIGSAASDMAGRVKESFAQAFNAGVLAAAIHPMTAPFVSMVDAARTAATTAGGHVAEFAKSAGSALNTMTVPARTAFAGIATAASIHANIMADQFSNAADRVGGNIKTAFANAGAELSNVGSNISSTMGRAWEGVSSAASTASSAVSNTFSSVAAKLKENFAPAAGAIREAFSGIGDHLAPIGGALSGVTTAAGDAARAIGSAGRTGLSNAAAGLIETMGGPWGIALGLATTALTMYAQGLAESKQKTEALAKTLDQASGQVTGATRNMLATNALDGATSDWDNFWRGMVDRSKSTEEALGKLGISTKNYTDKLADSRGRDAYVKGLQDISLAMNLGRPVTEEMAAAIGTTKEALKGLNGNDMMHLAQKAGDAAKELSLAEEQVRKIAEATGVSGVQAKIMEKNFETLASTTSTASDKFSALKNNLELLTATQQNNIGAHNAGISAEKAYQQTLDDTGKALQGLKDKNNGSVASLYDVAKGFDFTKAAGRELHTALEGQSDGILKIGTAALDQALKSGKSAADANSIALQAMAPGIETLRKTMADIGLSEPQINAIIKSFGLMPEQLTAAISVEGAEEAQRKIFLTKLAADAFANGNYKGVLGALPEAAKKAIASATGTADEYAKGNYQAVLDALDKTGPAKEGALAALLSVTDGNYEAVLKALNLTGDPVRNAKLEAQAYANGQGNTGAYTAELEARNNVFAPTSNATAMATAFKNGDYEAALKALNNTQSAVSDATGAAEGFARSDFTAALKAADATFQGRAIAASSLAGTTNATYLAWIKAAADTGSIESAKGVLDAAAYTRTAVIRLVADSASVQSANDFIKVSGGHYANGGIVNGIGTQVFANGGITKAVKAYATGGFEDHVAQIAPAGAMRLWAEPETGGEAYVPLSPSKRPRSLKILEQVAEMFGFSLVKKLNFASGGILASMQKSMPTQTVVRPSLSTTQPHSTAVVTNNSQAPTLITNVYPSAGLNEQQVADSVSENLYWKLTTQI